MKQYAVFLLILICFIVFSFYPNCLWLFASEDSLWHLLFFAHFFFSLLFLVSFSLLCYFFFFLFLIKYLLDFLFVPLPVFLVSLYVFSFFVSFLWTAVTSEEILSLTNNLMVYTASTLPTQQLLVNAVTFVEHELPAGEPECVLLQIVKSNSRTFNLVTN